MKNVARGFAAGPKPLLAIVAALILPDQYAPLRPPSSKPVPRSRRFWESFAASTRTPIGAPRSRRIHPTTQTQPDLVVWPVRAGSSLGSPGPISQSSFPPLSPPFPAFGADRSALLSACAAAIRSLTGLYAAIDLTDDKLVTAGPVRRALPHRLDRGRRAAVDRLNKLSSPCPSSLAPGAFSRLPSAAIWPKFGPPWLFRRSRQ